MVAEVTIPATFAATPRQMEAWNNWKRWTVYGGAEGGGKTRFMAEAAKMLMLYYPGIEGIIGRFDYNDVMAPTQIYDVFHQVCPPEIIQQAYHSAPAWTRFINGSRVTFSSFKDHNPSSQYGFCIIDQAEEVPEEIIRLMNGRLRQRLPSGEFPRFRMMLTCNPHPAIEWVLKECEEKPDNFAFVPAFYRDNPYLPDDFERERRASYTDDQYRRLIEGAWDVFAGQALTEFDRNVHVIEPFDLWRKERWPVWRGIDHGINHPTMCEWIAVSPENDLFVVQEYQRQGAIPSENAKAIAAMSVDMKLAGTIFDPRVREVKADLTARADWSIFDEYQRNGVYGEPSIGTREERLAAWKQALKPDPVRRHYLTHQPPGPRLYIFRNCQRLVWELPRLQYRDAIQGSEDIVKVDDDAYDAGGFVIAHLLNRRRSVEKRENKVGYQQVRRRR